MMASWLAADPVPMKGLKNGLQFAAYEGTWKRIPDFDTLEPAAMGACSQFSQSVYSGKQGAGGDNDFALKFTGFVKVPTEGLYFFYAKSDDGSQLSIGDQLVVDNDNEHPVIETGGMIRLKAGAHPITVTYFEKNGMELLEVYYEGPRLPKQKIPPAVLFSNTQEQPTMAAR